MTFDTVREMIGLSVDPVTADACRFLESNGLQFCVDFGTETAVGFAGNILIKRNPSLPIVKNFHMLGVGLQYLTDEDVSWLRGMEMAFGDTDLARIN